MSSQSDGEEPERIPLDRSEAVRRMFSFDRSKTVLGQPQILPPISKPLVRIMLPSSHPMSAWWSERPINLYNDGYVAFPLCQATGSAGATDPLLFGRRSGTKSAQTPCSRCAATRGLTMKRRPSSCSGRGYPEETYVTFSYSLEGTRRG